MIRRATPDDAAAWQALRLESLQAYPESFASSYAEECDRPLELIAQRLSDPSRHFWVAELQGQLVGTAVAAHEGMLKCRHRTHLYAMYVNPTARGRGIGQQLIAATVSSARDDFASDWLCLTVTASNTRAVNFYHQLGFVTWGQEPDSLRIDTQHYNAYHMALDLRISKDAP